MAPLADDAPERKPFFPQALPPAATRLADPRPAAGGGPATTASVVLAEQRSVVTSMGFPAAVRRRRTNSVVVSAADRRRLVQLATALLATAADKAEAECRQILQAADRKAWEIRQEAEDDVAQLSDGLRQLRRDQPSGDVPEPPTAVAASVGTPPRAEHPAAEGTATEGTPSDDDLGAEFFASFGGDDADRWRFLNDGELVGVGPTFRRLLRRPPRPRDKTTNDS